MQLRKCQEVARDAVFKALETRDNTLLSACTGFGKTITMAGIVIKGIEDKGYDRCLTLQHRDELCEQNMAKFMKVDERKRSISVFDSKTKSYRGSVVFGMVQSVANDLGRIPKFDLIQIDEAHHAAAPQYLSVIEAARDKNPDLKLVGVSATLVRGDKKTLAKTFDNVAHVVHIGDMVAAGYLVPPRTLKPHVGDVREEANSVAGKSDNDMNAAAKVVDKQVVTDEVLRHWRREAGDLKTIFFCTNIAHAKHVTEALHDLGVTAEVLHSKTPAAKRRQMIIDYERNGFQCLVNVMVATEGFDDQRIRCVVILRPCIHESTFIQIVGRVLRKIDQTLYPGEIKTEGLVMDFCTNHNSLELDITRALLEEKETKQTFKVCLQCHAEMPSRARECMICGYEFPAPIRQASERETVDHVRMIEIDILGSSKHTWIDLFDNGRTLMASGFRAWALIVEPVANSGEWLALGALKDDDGKSSRPQVIYAGHRVQCLASARDWMGLHEPNAAAGKKKSWTTDQISQGQAALLSRFGRWEGVEGMNKYAAACRIDYITNEKLIVLMVESHAN